MPLGFPREGEEVLRPASQETGQQATSTAVGCDGKETQMNTITLPALRSAVLPALVAALVGLGIVSMAGMAQSATLHDSAHDMRHANGFPCH